jgi:hypothetical protein
MSRRARVPGPARRLLRERSRTAAVVLLSVVAVATSGVQAGAAAALRETLDEEWRGSYDILVMPLDAEQPIAGMLPPNSLASTEHGLTFEDLAAVRDVDGVEIAAPIGEIAAPGLKFVFPEIAIPRDAVDASAQAYRVTVEFTTNDGLGERLVSTKSMDIVVEGSNRPPPPCDVPQITSGSFDNYEYTAEEYPALASMHCDYARPGVDGVYEALGEGWSFQDSGPGQPLRVQIRDAPQTVTRITLVDPVAERALLGEEDGAFLDPLIALQPGATTDTDTMLEWARADAGPYGQEFLDDQATAASMSVGYSEAVIADLRRLWAANDDDWDAYMAELNGAIRYAPILVSTAPAADLGVKVSVEAFGPATFREDDVHGFAYDFPAGMADGSSGTPVGTTVADISGALNPFADATAAVAWPGTDLASAGGLPDFNTLQFQAIGSVIDGTYTVAADGTLSLKATGYRGPALQFGAGGPPDYFHLGADAAVPGVEAAYSGMEPGPSVKERPVAAVPIGTFDFSATESQLAADYVPLGAYEPVASTISGGEYDGAELLPSVTGLGLVGPRTVAIASIGSAEAWGQEAPISAIRVRVGGIDAYTVQGQERVVAVAQAIQSLGYRAVVVAGSSPSEVSVQIDDYAFGVDSADAAQTVGPLGTVVQRWSELGAAARAELAISSSSLTILGLALSSTVLLLGVVQFVGLPRRREQSSTLRAVGFTRMRIARWLAAEEGLALGVVILVAALALWLSGVSVLTAAVAAAVVAAVAVSSAIVIVVGSRPAASSGLRTWRSRRTGARSVFGFGMRQSIVHGLTSATHIAAIAIVGVSAAGLVSVVLRSRAEVGNSLLATLIADQQLVPQVALGACGVVAGVVMTFLGRRLDLARRQSQWSALRAAGWTSGELARAQRAEMLTLVAPALALAGGLAWLGAVLLELPSPLLLTAVAVATGLIAATVAFANRSKGTAR